MAERRRPTSWTDDMSISELPKGLLLLSMLALIGGAFTGVVGAAFRWSLLEADKLRVEIVEWAHQWPVFGIFIPIGLAALFVAIARYITTLVPEAAGSGVQRVEGAMRHEIPLETGRVVPAKFAGGLLAIGSGLALGREGPTVQMGASIGSKLGKIFRIGRRGSEELEASLAGAGLAVAFNAPLGAAIFVFEELTRAYKLRLIVATLVGAATAAVVSRAMLGNISEYSLGAITPPDFWQHMAYGAFGLIMGLLGAWYNKTVVWFLDLMRKVRQTRPEILAAVVGGFVGMVAWFAPTLVGGGENIPQEMFTSTPVWWAILGILLFRWFLGPLSHAVGTPGGLFAPLLAVGASAGALYASILNFLPMVQLPVSAFAFVGMSALFAGVVRAPVTGIVITAEMAATTSLLVPSLMAGVGAMIAATLIKSEPIYDTLRQRAPGFQPKRVESD